jgi:hypothetical protein
VLLLIDVRFGRNTARNPFEEQKAEKDTKVRTLLQSMAHIKVRWFYCAGIFSFLFFVFQRTHQLLIGRLGGVWCG